MTTKKKVAPRMEVVAETPGAEITKDFLSEATVDTSRLSAKRSDTGASQPEIRGASIPAASGVPVHIHGVEGILGSLDLTFYDGMNLLTGNNEDGKTSATRAVVTAAGGSIGRPLRPHDAAGQGVVRAFGTVVTIGGRTTRAGAPSVELADYGTLGELIEPAGKTAATRDKRRVDVLMDYVERRVDAVLLLEMAGGDEEVAGGVQFKKGEDLSLRAAATAVKRVAEAVARDYEGRAKAAQDAERAALGEVERLKKDLAGYPRPDGGAQGAEARYQEAIRSHERLKRERELRVAREQERAQWGDVGERPDIEALEEEYAALTEQIGGVEQQLKELRRRQEEVVQGGRNRRAAVDQWELRKRALAASVTGPEEDEVTAAADAVRDASSDLEAAQLYAKVDEELERIAAARAANREAQRQAERRRVVARGVGAVVNGVLKSEDLCGLALDESDAHGADEEEGKGEARWRLCRIDPVTGALEPFERLSLGARTRLVITGIGCRKYPGRVMPIEPGFWYALQPSRQRELVKVAVEERIKLLSEIPTDEAGVSVVHLGAEFVEGDERAEAYVQRKLQGAAAS